MQRAVPLIPRLSTVPSTSFRLSRMTTAAPSAKCPKFVSVEGSDIYSRGQPDGFRFRLVSYNILAQAYVKSSLFPHSPKSCLRWKVRSQRTLTLLKNLEADFLCLQEVDEYDEYYRGNMNKDGYTSIYIQRTGQKRDGCGIFYKQDRAELVLEETIEYNDLVNTVQDTADATEKPNDEPLKTNGDAETKSGSSPEKSPEDRGDPNDPRVRLKRDCVGIMAAFRLKDPSGTLLILANTHLYWDPEWQDVKLAQASYLLSRLALFKIQVSEKFDCTPLVIVAGDFNSTPGDKVHQYLISGDISSAIPEFVDELPIPLRSVYASTGGEPPFTNCTPGFTDTIDYIFFSPSSSIKPVSFLELPEADSPDVAGGLPNHHHPSDHLPIGAEFEVVS